jgi:hypothetical protein
MLPPLWPGLIIGNAPKPIKAGAACEPHQQGLELIIGMVCGQNSPRPERPRAISDCFVARGPRRRFKTFALSLPCADANLQRLANHTTRLGKRPTVLRPRICSWLQAVMDVNGVQ